MQLEVYLACSPCGWMVKYLSNHLAQAPEVLDDRCVLVAASNPEKIEPPMLQIQFHVAGKSNFWFFVTKALSFIIISQK